VDLLVRMGSNPIPGATFPVSVHENPFIKFSALKTLGLHLAETDEYDRIFAALKHPLRRQILLLLEEKGEISFTDIQKAVGVNDTGLLSYHLKELGALVEQSERGKYELSEIGRASMALFWKVEREKRASDGAIRNYFERIVGEIVFLFLIVGATFMAPLSADIYLSAQTVFSSSLTTQMIVLVFLTSLLGMVFGSILFLFYDRHYFAKNPKTNAVHSLLFAVGIALMSTYLAYISYQFEMVTANGNNFALWFSILRAAAFLGITPIATYSIGAFLNRC
jgi:DNA-binding transcriptional ArsR family regulator